MKFYKEYDEEYDFDYCGMSNREDDLICRYYKYYGYERKSGLTKFTKHRKIRYDGFWLHSVTLFGYAISWGRFYEWIDREDERFMSLLIQHEVKQMNAAFALLEK